MLDESVGILGLKACNAMSNGYMTELLTLLSFSLFGALISYYDFRERRVPNILVTLLLATGIFLVFLQECNPWVPLWCMLGLGGGAFLIRFFYLITQEKEALGMGDIKLLGAVGWWIQPLDIPAFLFFTGLSGALVGGIWFYMTKEKEFPFAPAIFLGYLILRFLKLESLGNSGILCGTA